MDLHELVVKLKELYNELGRTPTLKEFEKSGISKRQIHKHKYSVICKAADLEVNRRPQDTPSMEIIIRPPKILMLDIETSPVIAKVWGLFDQNISLNQIEQDWYVLSYAAKWYGSDEMFYQDQRAAEPLGDDSEILKGIHKLMNEADYLCGHNAKRFDVKKLNARFIKHSLPPIKQVPVIDTLLIARRVAAFTSNKLEYLAKFLGCEDTKMCDRKFNGMLLWVETMKRNVEAFDEMELYCKMDVIVLEQVYERLIPYDNSISFQAFHQKKICTCGGIEFKKNGFRYTRQGCFRVYVCVKCSKTITAKENLIDKEVRKELAK